MLLDLEAINLGCEPMEEERRGFSIEWEETRERHFYKNIQMKWGNVERRNLLELSIETRLSLIGEERRGRVVKITKVRRGEYCLLRKTLTTLIAPTSASLQRRQENLDRQGIQEGQATFHHRSFPFHVPLYVHKKGETNWQYTWRKVFS